MQARQDDFAKLVDVSHYQGNIDWEHVRAANYVGAYLKATQGTRFIDDKLSQNIVGCEANGILIGVYHFLQASTAEQGIAEADAFISTIIDMGGIDVFLLPPVVDVEDHNNTPEAAEAFADRVDEVFGLSGTIKETIVYTYPSFINEIIGNTLSHRRLWYAFYNNGVPGDKGNWSEWLFEQYSDIGLVPGIVGSVDLDVFKGTNDEFFAYFNPAIENEAPAPYVISEYDANKIIGFCSAAWESSEDQAGRDEFHRQAEVLRGASNQLETFAPVSVEDTPKLIGFLAASFEATPSDAAKAEFHRLADEVRKSAGIAV